MRPPFGTRKRHWPAVFLIFWGAGLLTHASGLFPPLHCDYSTWLRVARDWKSGQKLYAETYDHKQPPVIMLAALLDSSRPAVSVYFAETLLLAIAATALFVALMSTLPRAAWIAPLLLIAWTGASQTHVGGQTMEAFSLSLDVIALSCCVLAARRNSLTAAIVAGAAYFVMGSLRLPNFLDGFAYLPFLAVAYRRGGAQAGRRLLVGFLVGFALSAAALLAFSVYDGHLRDALDVTLFNFHYGSLDRIPLAQSLLNSVKVVARIAMNNTLLLALLMMAAVLWIRHRKQSANVSQPASATRTFERAWTQAAVCGALLTYVATFPGGRHYPHYYHMLWGPLSILAALGLARLSAVRAARPFAAILSVCAVAASFLQAGAVNLDARSDWQRKHQDGEDPRIAIAEAAVSIEHETGSGTPLAMYVWRENAELYLQIARPALSYSIPDTLPDDKLEEWAKAVLNSATCVVVVDEWFFRRKSKSTSFLRLRRMLRHDALPERTFGTIKVYRLSRSNR